jgi:hypothetical protein
MKVWTLVNGMWQRSEPTATAAGLVTVAFPLLTVAASGVKIVSVPPNSRAEALPSAPRRAKRVYAHVPWTAAGSSASGARRTPGSTWFSKRAPERDGRCVVGIALGSRSERGRARPE